jgi:broad specificity phosphatase PhoE
MPGT